MHVVCLCTVCAELHLLQGHMGFWSDCVCTLAQKYSYSGSASVYACSGYTLPLECSVADTKGSITFSNPDPTLNCSCSGTGPEWLCYCSRNDLAMAVLLLWKWSCNDFASARKLVLQTQYCSPALELVLQWLCSCSGIGPAMTVLLFWNWSCNDCAPALELILQYCAPALELILQLLCSCSVTGPAMTVLLLCNWSCNDCSCSGTIPAITVLLLCNWPCNGCAPAMELVHQWLCSCNDCAYALELILQWLCSWYWSGPSTAVLLFWELSWNGCAPVLGIG
jgi:hypothetical protein